MYEVLLSKISENTFGHGKTALEFAVIGNTVDVEEE
jgi:hypothetical protein